MGSTHTRSHFKEQTTGLKIAFSNASIVTATIATAAITTANITTANITTINSTNYYMKLGTNVYIIRNNLTAFTKAVCDAVATSIAGGTATRLLAGTMILSASKNHPASTCFTKTGPATWCNVTLGANLS